MTSSLRGNVSLIGLLAAAFAVTCRGEVAPPPGTKIEPTSTAVTAAKRGFKNVALGKPCTLKPAPRYRHCTDPGDKTQLTDGKYVSEYFWVQKGTVGWQHPGTVLVTIDLGGVEPIRGATFHTAAGTAGVGWPTQVSVFVSEDGKTYHWVGDLVELSAARGLPQPMGYREYTYWTDQLQTKGRYVQIAAIPGSAYLFCDEIEVWRGEDAWVARPMGGKKVGNVAAYLRTAAGTGCVRLRMRMDADTIRKALRSVTKPSRDVADSLKKLDELSKRIGAFTVEDSSALRAIVPLNKLHKEILSCHAAALRARGVKACVVWQGNRWDPLSILDAPPSPDRTNLNLTVRMMRGEYRATAFNLTNAGPSTWTATVQISGLPGQDKAKAAKPDYLTVYEVVHVDTKQGVVVADALREPQRPHGISIPAGTTKQIWLAFHPTTLKPGRYDAELRVGRIRYADEIGESPQIIRTIPMSLQVENIDFPMRPSLSLGTWDYMNHPPYHRDLTAKNIKAAIADAKAHFHDAPWATNGVMPFPQTSQVDGDGNLKVDTLDFSKFDKWFNDWKDYARRYMVFSNVPKHIAGRQMGTPEFDRVAGQWYSAWADHCKKLGIKPKQVALLIVDEPHVDSQYRHILAWAKAIRAATDFFSIWEDPVDRKLGTSAQTATLELCDAICPNLGIYNRLGKRAEDYYAKLVAGGKRELWFYQCTGPVRLLCPYAYHRLQAWHCWVHGAVGQGFWAYADAGSGDPWCEYLCKGTTYCPAYVAPDGITTSKHWEAVREGIEDYEYLHMLKARVDALTQAGKTSPALDKARKLLVEGPKRVAVYEPISWFQDRDRSLADTVRLEVLDALLALKDL